ncbi:MAG: hypothetical protein K2I96_03635 [Lachnospiraceae bacterium]|nr:hypothetical protein [Lachnospiraceae bacterium]
MKILTRPQIIRRLEKVNERLDSYYAKEKEMLAADGIQSYTIGSRTVSRYQYSSNIKEQIGKLEDERDELENLLNGISPRKAMAAVPRDW